MLFSRRRAILAASLYPVVGRATIPLPVSLAETMTHAKVVALVRIASGRMVSSSKGECGARYAAAVVRTYKGDVEARTLEFGPYYNLRIGAHYLVFLAGGPLASERYGSTNSMEQNSRAAFLLECTSVAAPLSIVSFGHGAMLVEETLGPPDEWTIDWKSLIEPPKDMQLRTSPRSDNNSVSIAEFERVLGMLQ